MQAYSFMLFESTKQIYKFTLITAEKCTKTTQIGSY